MSPSGNRISRSRLAAQARSAAGGLGFAVLLVLAGCSTQHYRESADRETYAILRQKNAAVLGEERVHEIKTPDEAQIKQFKSQPLRQAGAASTSAPVTGPEAPETAELTRPVALQLASKRNREYLSQVEILYLSALDLTLERFTYDPHLSAGAGGEWNRQSNGDQTISGEGSFGFTRMLAAGGSFALTLTTDALRYVVGTGASSGSSLALSLAQPLWRGAGKRIEQENLTQAERNTIYAVRAFARFQQTFAVSITSQFYRALQERDSLANAESNYDRLVVARQRTEALANAGRLPKFEVDQAQQDEYSAHDSLVQAQESYEATLDDLKIQLGLPVTTIVTFSESALNELKAEGLPEPGLDLDQALSVAPCYRLDYLTTVDGVADRARKIDLAVDALNPDVNLRADYTLATAANQPTLFQTNKATYSAGLDVDLPLNRVAQRNAYRRALIDFERATRQLSLATDELKQTVRGSWRALRAARESYRIQEMSVELAQRRVDSVNLLLQGGRASTRDLLDAESALLRAKNALTAALINYRVALLQFWRDTGVLRIDENGLLRRENYYEIQTTVQK